MRLALDPPTDPDRYAFAHEIRVRFGETDAMGVVHHAAYLLYLEETRVAWLAALGRPYAVMHAEGVDFAVLEAFVRYRSALRFDEVVTVHVGIGTAPKATFQLGYLLTVDGEPRATAVTVHGCMDRDGRAARMPAWLREVPVSPLDTGHGPRR